MLVNFFGKRGAGKTTAIRGQFQDCRGPVVVLDILGNFNDPTYIHVEKTDEMILLIADYVKNPDGKQKIICVKTADPDTAVDFASAALWKACRGTLILDEADGFSITNAPCFDQLVRYGRNRNIDLITGCRRPAEISRNITAGANQIFAFKTQEPRDIDYFSSTIFGDRAEELMRVPDYSGLFIDYDQDLVGQFKIDKNGRIYKTNNAGFQNHNKEFSSER